MPHYQGVIKNRQRLHVHHAGREVLGRIVLLDVEELGGPVDAGGPRTALAQLHLEMPLAAARGDRMVLRFYSPVTTIAGGKVLDPTPERHKRFDEQALAVLDVMEHGDADELLRQRLRDAQLKGVPLAEMSGLADDPAVLQAGKRLYLRELTTALATRVAELVATYAERYPLRLGIPKEEVRRRMKFKGGVAEWNALVQALAEPGRFVVAGDRIALDPAGPPLTPAQTGAVTAVSAELMDSGLDWPGLEAFAAASPALRQSGLEPVEVLRHLADHDLAVPINNDYYVHTETLQDLVGRLRAHFAATPEMAFGEFRELSGLSRKLGIPLLEYLDEQGITVRKGDVRQAGGSL